MSGGHQHMGGPSMTQNQGNVLGDRPCVRQSKLYREHVGGNAMKELMGQGNLKWDTNKCEGAYSGSNAQGPASEAEGRRAARESPKPAPQQAQSPYGSGGVEPQQQQRRGGRGAVPQQQEYQQQRQQSERDAGGVDAMKHRPGAGQANRQTFNLFGGN